MSASPPVFQVSELADEMRRLVEASYPEIWIEGELSSLSTPASGHLYFTLKDEQSQLRCAMFRNRASISSYRPVAGDLVRVRAKISVYTARGDLQCIVQHIEEAGEGLLQRRFEELKAKLNREGLFATEYKKSVPTFPRHIALITSPSGAALHDVLSTLQRRAPSIAVTIYPAVVQGDSAVKSLIQAIDNAVAHQRADVILLCRGGGSLEDLWCFNDETLAQTIFNCRLPIVAGVGHEVDITIADLVADQRAPTPTAAAEILSPDQSQLDAQLKNMAFRLPASVLRNFQRLAQSVDLSFSQLIHPLEKIQHRMTGLTQCSGRLDRAMQSSLDLTSHRLSHHRFRLAAQDPVRKVTAEAERVRVLSGRLLRAQQQGLGNTQQRFSAVGNQLNLVNPLATLGRGFSITRDSQANILRDAQQLRPSDKVSVQLRSGSLECEVLQIKP